MRTISKALRRICDVDRCFQTPNSIVIIGFFSFVVHIVCSYLNIATLGYFLLLQTHTCNTRLVPGEIVSKKSSLKSANVYAFPKQVTHSVNVGNATN